MSFGGKFLDLFEDLVLIYTDHYPVFLFISKSAGMHDPVLVNDQ